MYEGLPTTVIEAASNCVPVICSDFKSGSNEILKNGKGGYFFKVKDYEVLSKLILKFYRNPKPFFRKELVCRKNLIRFDEKKKYKFISKFFKKV